LAQFTKCEEKGRKRKKKGKKMMGQPNLLSFLQRIPKKRERKGALGRKRIPVQSLHPSFSETSDLVLQRGGKERVIRKRKGGGGQPPQFWSHFFRL